MDNLVDDWVGHNLLASDPALLTALRNAAPQAVEPLTRYGAELGSAETAQLARDANRHGPQLRSLDARGRRIDLVDFHPSWHALLAMYRRQGLVADVFATDTPGRWAAFAAGCYLHGQVEAGSLCPATMTQAAVPVLARQPELFAPLREKFFSRVHDPREAPIADKASIWVGMGMTEKQGGSDLRRVVTTATEQGGQHAVDAAHLQHLPQAAPRGGLGEPGTEPWLAQQLGVFGAIDHADLHPQAKLGPHVRQPCRAANAAAVAVTHVQQVARELVLGHEIGVGLALGAPKAPGQHVQSARLELDESPGPWQLQPARPAAHARQRLLHELDVQAGQPAVGQAHGIRRIVIPAGSHFAGPGGPHREQQAEEREGQIHARIVAGLTRLSVVSDTMQRCAPIRVREKLTDAVRHHRWRPP